jgi:hypothetical protein
MPAPRPFLTTYLEPLTRALLLSLGLDHALIDFLALTAIGAVTVLLAILVVAIRIPRRQSAPSIPRIPK